MVVEIPIKVDDAEIQTLLRHLAAAAIDMKPALSVIGEIIKSSVDQNFIAHGRYSSVGSWLGGSKKWDALKKSTIKARARRGRTAEDILLDHGHLAASITSVIGDESVDVGTNMAYAAIHQFGKTINVSAHKGSAKHRTTKVGGDTLKRQPGYKNLAVFASSKHTAFKAIEFKIGAHTITIPARPFLVVQPEDLAEITNTIVKHIGLAGG